LRVLVTGAGGFVGGHLCRYLIERTEWKVVGTVYPKLAAPSLRHSRLQYRHIDLRDPAGVTDLVEQVAPEGIFHLAAQSSVSGSYSDPWTTLESNVRGQLNLLESVRLSGRAVRFLVVGSNEEYGAPQPDELPQTETSPLRPQSPYAVSKVAQDMMGLQYNLAHGVEVIRVRPFNHTGPGQSPRFVVPAFASQVARIEAGKQTPVLKVGNLDVSRDFTDVRDIVAAYVLAVQDGDPGDVYNLCSGQPRSVKWVLDTLLSAVDADITVERDPNRYRPADTPLVYGDSMKFRSLTGWCPRIPFEQTLLDTLAYWRGEVVKEDNPAGGVTNA
jgi:GDP-4-dehydro-6-deoxy-D-mannose reductase